MLYIGSDHRGYLLKEKLKDFFLKNKIDFEDLGAKELDPLDDFVDYAVKVSSKVSEDKNSLGVVICGSGVGVCVAANKIRGVRCGIGFEVEQVYSAKFHDHINVLALSADYIEFEKAVNLLKKFLETNESNEEKYLRRITKISNLEK